MSSQSCGRCRTRHLRTTAWKVSIEVQNYHNNHNYPTLNDMTVIRVSLRAADFDATFMNEAFYSWHTAAEFRKIMERINEHYNKITKKL